MCILYQRTPTTCPKGDSQVRVSYSIQYREIGRCESKLKLSVNENINIRNPRKKYKGKVVSQNSANVLF